MRTLAVAATAAAVLLSGCTAEPRTEYRVDHDGVSLRVLAEGAGPTVVLLPSRGRDSLDYDAVAAGIAAQGYRVLRPQPRGTAGSTGPLAGLTLHDLAGDVARVVESAGSGPAVLVGHAYGNWVARMTAVDHPDLVRGIVIAAAAAAEYPPELSERVTRSADPARTEAERLDDLRAAFFADGNDPRAWLTGWWPEASSSQRAAGLAVPQDVWWPGGTVPILDLQAGQDPFRPAGTRDEIRAEFGERVTVAVVDGASHALLPEQPAAVVAEITGWLRGLPAAG